MIPNRAKKLYLRAKQMSETKYKDSKKTTWYITSDLYDEFVAILKKKKEGKIHNDRAELGSVVVMRLPE